MDELDDKSLVESSGRELEENVKAHCQRRIDLKETIIYEETLTLPGGDGFWLTTLTPVMKKERRNIWLVPARILHCKRRLNDNCYAVGRHLKITARELDEMNVLAMLHDIGKVGIKESIMQKPGPLTAAEWDEMKKHPEIGFRIAQNMPELSAVGDYILSHHERWDGKGYPRGLKGLDIPVQCRILAVADAYDAMTNDRVYRKAIGKKEALEELKRIAGLCCKKRNFSFEFLL
ncbi:MAG: HD domain-containing phosphohydrolase [Bacillota bacterium]|nr:HD domain-containing phosphohydrolase [Bacillota bacterium]